VNNYLSLDTDAIEEGKAICCRHVREACRANLADDVALDG
jgi:hypothetical protein